MQKLNSKNCPRITIVTPSYNQGLFLQRTVESILSQNYPNLEYFIVDGGSTDNSVDIIREYEGKIDWWVSENDDGQSEAINKGFSKATGELLCWVNSDDVLLPYALERVARAYKEKFDVDIITGNIIYIDRSDLIVRCIKVPRMRWFFYRFGVGYFAAPAVFFKKELFEKVGKLDVNLHLSMDIDVWHKFRLEEVNIFHVKEYLGGFRVHAHSKTGDFRQKEPKAFENPETTFIRTQYIPHVSKRTIKIFRVIFKLWQVFNLNYLRSRLDLYRWKEKTWQEIFARK